MFQYDKNTVCKFLATAELEFYQNIPESLKPFTPQFRGKAVVRSLRESFDPVVRLGVVSVQYDEDESGAIRLFARPQTLTDESNDENDSSNNAEASTTENTLLKSIQ